MDIEQPSVQRMLGRLRQPHAAADVVTVLGVKYLHLQFPDGDELYVTAQGLPFLPVIAPGSVWTDREYVTRHAVRLAGTSTVYRIVPKHNPLRREVVLKWNRMGQDIPGETGLLFPTAFNSPFEEFSLVEDLRQTETARRGRLLPQKPLGIYIPHEVVLPWQLGRKDHLMPSHEEVSLDTSKNYAVIYEWLKGLDLVEAQAAGLLDPPSVGRLTLEVDGLLGAEGYVVADRKPNHVIVRAAADGGVRPGRGGHPLLGLVDFELLKRTPDYDMVRRRKRRKEYLERQARRFEIYVPGLPANLHATTVLGADYVYGEVEGTDAELWVVGRDPALFEYFRPEKWRRTPRTKLSTVNQTYHTLTKDDINVVWKVSKVGEIPPVDPSTPRDKDIVQYGFNSPFEEVALAQAMSRDGINVIYPRAIYMTGQRTRILHILADDRRYEAHAGLLTPLGKPVLRKDRDYVTIWGYWNGLDQDLSVDDNHHLSPMSAFLAYHHGFITEADYLSLLHREEQRLLRAGYEDLNFKGSHLLISLDAGKAMLRDEEGMPKTRVCNFELIRRAAPAATPPAH
jgi:hypothetical protein